MSEVQHVPVARWLWMCLGHPRVAYALDRVLRPSAPGGCGECRRERVNCARYLVPLVQSGDRCVVVEQGLVEVVRYRMPALPVSLDGIAEALQRSVDPSVLVDWSEDDARRDA